MRQYDDRDMPFVSVGLMSLATPAFDGFDAGAVVPHVRGAPFAFAMSATDRQGLKADFATPMVFVRADEVNNLAAAARAFQPFSRIDLRNQQIAFTATQPAQHDRQCVENRGDRAHP